MVRPGIGQESRHRGDEVFDVEVVAQSLPRAPHLQRLAAQRAVGQDADDALPDVEPLPLTITFDGRRIRCPMPDIVAYIATYFSSISLVMP